MYPGYYKQFYIDKQRKSALTFNMAPRDLAVCYNNSPYISTFPWTPSKWSLPAGFGPGGFGAKYANPLSLPVGTANGVAFCGSTDIAVAHSNSPYVSAYPWTPGTGFGVKYADPLTLPGVQGYGVAFCGSTDIAVGCPAANLATYTYPWTPGTGFGVKYGNPLTLPLGFGHDVAFCGSTDIAICDSSSSSGTDVAAYPWTPTVGFGLKYANPIIRSSGQGERVSFRM